MLGHTKTILVLLTSWVVLHEQMPARKALGMLLAVAGMVLYGYLNSMASSGSSSSSSANGSSGSAEGKPLLPVQGGGKLPHVASRDKLQGLSSREGMVSEGSPLIRGSGSVGSRSSRSTQDLTAGGHH